MRDLRIALLAAMTADTRVSQVPIGAVPTTTVIPLGLGEAATWNKRDLLYVTGASAAAGNNVRTIVDRDTGLDTITLSDPLPFAPAVGDQIRGGCREWLWYQSASLPGIYEEGRAPAPVDELLKAGPAEKRVVVVYSDPVMRPDGMARERVIWPWLGWSFSREHLEGLGRRLKQLLHARKSALNVAGHHMHELFVHAFGFPLIRGLRHTRFEIEIVITGVAP